MNLNKKLRKPDIGGGAERKGQGRIHLVRGLRGLSPPEKATDMVHRRTLEVAALIK